jgi:hypothetical protein
VLRRARPVPRPAALTARPEPTDVVRWDVDLPVVR